MRLEITNYNNYFKIKGDLNRNNVHQFKSEFKHVFENAEAITISIEALDSIDRYGVNALAQLHNESLIKNKRLSIIGMGCKDLYQHFKSEEAAA
ncbi:STAS domain-containing protein [Ichthyenterobacterium magnum]|nr:STAS domain-containing protein [Ichthyenterobacterium magnum]